MAHVHILFQTGLLITHFKPLIVKCYLWIIKNYLFALLTINNSNKLIRINMSNISIQKMGFCRNDYIKYSSQFPFTLLCDNVHMHLKSIGSFAFLEDVCKKSFNFLRSNICHIQPNLAQHFI